jgi:hypothetical protein
MARCIKTSGSLSQATRRWERDRQHRASLHAVPRGHTVARNSRSESAGLSRRDKGPGTPVGRESVRVYAYRRVPLAPVQRLGLRGQGCAREFSTVTIGKDGSKGVSMILGYAADALHEIEGFFRKHRKAIIALTVREILDEEIAKKLA